MKKSSTAIYTVIALSAVIAYVGFLFRGGVSETDVIEETLPHVEEKIIIEEPTQATEEATEPPVTLPASATSDNVPIEEETEIKEKVFSPQYPVDGDITLFFSSKLIYNEISGDWRSHPGIDIKADKTARVLAAEDGTVTTCREDALYGKMIEIDHGGYKTVYKNLSTTAIVSEGDYVSKGQVISGVGDESAFEGAYGAHIHFEIIAPDGQYVDPLTLLGKH